MSSFNDVQTFVGEANRVADMSSLRGLLEDSVKTLGFDYFALLHHVDLSRRSEDYVRLVQYPQAWKEQSLTQHYYSDDPILAVSQKSVTPFLWTDVPRLMPLTQRQEEILNSAHLAGMGDGVTVPINIPGEFSGSCSFCMRTGRDIPLASLPMAQYLGCFAFQAARRLIEMHAAVKPAIDPNTMRCARASVVRVVNATRDHSPSAIPTISKATPPNSISNAALANTFSSTAPVRARRLA